MDTIMSVSLRVMLVALLVGLVIVSAVMLK